MYNTTKSVLATADANTIDKMKRKKKDTHEKIDPTKTQKKNT